MSDLHALSDPTPETLPALPPAHRVGDGPRYERLSIEDISLILRLNADGKTQTEIAQRLGKHQTSVSRVIRKLGTDSSEVATTLLKARAYRSAVRVAHIAEKGRDEHAIRAAKVVLAASGVTERDRALNVGFQINIGTVEKPAADAQTITVQAVSE